MGVRLVVVSWGSGELAVVFNGGVGRGIGVRSVHSWGMGGVDGWGSVRSVDSWGGMGGVDSWGSMGSIDSRGSMGGVDSWGGNGLSVDSWGVGWGSMSVGWGSNDGLQGRGGVHGRGNGLDDGWGSVDGWAGFGDDGVESVNVIGGVVDGAHRTVGFNQRVLSLHDVSIAALDLGFHITSQTVMDAVVERVLGVGVVVSLVLGLQRDKTSGGNSEESQAHNDFEGHFCWRLV